MDALLEAVAMYKKRNPKTADEQECCENLFNCLCSALVRGGRLGVTVCGTVCARVWI